MENSLIICRCEKITVSKIEEAIDAGCRSIKAIKQYTRSGMGSCQGRICAPLILNILKNKGYEVCEEDKPAFPLNPIFIKEMRDGNV